MDTKILIVFLISASSTCCAVKIPQKPKENLEWWQEGLIYQIYPRSHKDSDSDGVGDLLGIESKLDHFVDIGVSAVWISPIFKSPMKDFGYDISNFTDIEPVFGNMTTFKSLSNALKERGIKLIMDFVPNHSSDEHPWFEKSVARIDPYTDYYVWKDPKGYDEDRKPIPPNNWVSVFGGSMWEWRPERQQFYLHQFLAGQPDLNYENPKVLTEMLAVVKFWLDRGVDGLRIDAVAHLFEDPELRDEPINPDRPVGSLPNEWFYYLHPYTYNLPKILDVLYQFRQLLDVYTLSDGKERFMMTEVVKLPIDQLMAYYGTTDKPIANFPLNFHFITQLNTNFTANDIISIVDEWFEKMPEGRTANWLVGNHDNHRVSARFGDYVIDPFNMIIHLLPGASITYYGEEIGMQNTWISWEDTVDPYGCNAGPDRYELFSRDPERTPMQWDATKNSGFSTGDETWLPVNENYTRNNVERQNGVPESHLEIYRTISLLRKSDVWKFGSLQTINRNSLNIFGFSRILDGHGFLVLANFGDTEAVIDTRMQFEEIPDSATVYARSAEFIPACVEIGDMLDTTLVPVGAKHSLILEF